jgi:hypothetical protein
MSTIAKITPHLRDTEAPSDIRNLPAWLIWRLEHHENEDKPRKVPYYAGGSKRHGKQGTPEDCAKLVTFDAAKRAAAKRGFDGVGLATLSQFGICALDFDNCVRDGRVHPDIEPLLTETYAEWSPSGMGLRVLYQGDLGNAKSFDGPFGMETFSSKGFVTFTGDTVDGQDLLGLDDTIAPLSPAALALYSRRFTRRDAPTTGHDDPVLGLSDAQIRQALTVLDPDMAHQPWLEVGMALHHETRGEGFDYWCEWSELGSKFPGRDTLRHRWDSFGKGDGGVITGRTLVRLANQAGAALNVGGPASPDEFEAMVADALQELEVTPSKAPRFHFEPIATFSSATALPWMVKGVLPKGALGVVYGASGSGKSFVVLDMGMAIARGVEWRQRRVKQGRVAYIAAEGADGFRKRIAAYCQANSLDPSTIPMTVLNAAPNLMEKDDARDIVLGVKASGGADLIIVDTLAQSMPGANENAGEDVGKALGYCKLIHKHTGAMVLLIHHSGKDATKGARGWSGLRAAADAEIEVVRGDTGRAMKLTKNKDGEDGQEWGFDLEVVQLGVDEDLDPITSCVVVEAQVPVGGVAAKKMGKNQRIVYDVVMEMGESQSAGIEVDAVVKEAARRIMAANGMESDLKGNTRGRARAALRDLLNDDSVPFFLDGDDGKTLGVG